ncbi:strictosidine synthase [Dictyocaulus viviparus]|uniref:Strictosidine synthase n=1 Tax=Dictyocaulus viviparus TaxID=29172 RepID=A0A0D8XVS7_DICVI|nr:strictosidine synthase [Dictyocaulus viviparus]
MRTNSRILSLSSERKKQIGVFCLYRRYQNMWFGIGKLFLYGIIGLLLSWTALWYRYRDPNTKTTQLYELPQRPKLIGPLAVNDKLQSVEYILKEEIVGPESLVVEGESIYTGLYDGRVVHIKNNKIIKEIKFTKATRCGSFDTEPTCGRPLGIRRLNKDELVVADAYLGIFIVNFKAGTFRHIVKSTVPIEGRFMRFLNDIEVLNEDQIIFTDSSSKWDRRHVIHIFLESQPLGRILKHTISTGRTEVVADNLYFPNGIQLHPDGNSVVFAECSRATVKQLNLQTNKMTSFATNLPGFPDNIRNGANGTLWIGLAGVRHIDAPSMIDAAGAYPLLRQILIDIIPSRWWIQYVHMLRPSHAMIIQLDADGNIIQSLHDTKGKHIQDVSQAFFQKLPYV